MLDSTPSYRAHNPGHDYYAPGIYLITLVVRDRRNNARMFGGLNDNIKQPGVMLNDLGKAVLACWGEIPERQAKHNRKIVVHTAVCMPDHFHGVIEIVERMDVSLGEVIRGFKAGCTQAWRAFRRNGGSGQRPSMVAETDNEAAHASPNAQPCSPNAQPYLDEQQEREMLKRMSKKQRAEYYAQHPEAQQPLWDDNYDDTICISDPVSGEYSLRHFTAMLNYVGDNARRAIIMRQRPEFMQRCLHVRIASHRADGITVMRDYAAFGNLFLLRWARKVQVYCHRLARRSMLTDEEWQKATANTEVIRRIEVHARKHNLGHFDYDWYRCTHPDTITAVDYTRTVASRHEHDAWVAQVMAGATVVVTPGISKGEQLMKDECIEKGYPLIHLQKEPIGALWKPEKKRFDACSNGHMLILAPWKADELGDVNGVSSRTDYSIFHNMNKLAEEICLFDGNAVVVK